MTNQIRELKGLLSYQDRQFRIHESYVKYWTAMATTGAAKSRNTQQGREPTEDEKSRGITIGWRDHTEDEKIKSALDTAKRHIQIMVDFQDAMVGTQTEIDELEDKRG
jgi:hypothetical protein